MRKISSAVALNTTDEIINPFANTASKSHTYIIATEFGYYSGKGGCPAYSTDLLGIIPIDSNIVLTYSARLDKMYHILSHLKNINTVNSVDYSDTVNTIINKIVSMGVFWFNNRKFKLSLNTQNYEFVWGDSFYVLSSINNIENE